MVLSSPPKWNRLSLLVASRQNRKGLEAQEGGELSEGKLGTCFNPVEKEAQAGLKPLGEHR